MIRQDLVHKTHDVYHTYSGLPGSPAVCLIRVYRKKATDEVMVIATELPNNYNVRVTNVTEHLAWEWREKLHVVPDKFTWIEYRPIGFHNAYTSATLANPVGEFWRVELIESEGGYKVVDWHQIRQRDVENFIGDVWRVMII